MKRIIQDLRNLCKLNAFDQGHFYKYGSVSLETERSRNLFNSQKKISNLKFRIRYIREKFSVPQSNKNSECPKFYACLDVFA